MLVSRLPIATSSNRDGICVDDNLGRMSDDADAALTMSSTTTSLLAASKFAGGDRKIDAYLRETKTTIHALMSQWLVRRKEFRERRDDKVDESDEPMCEAAEDIDQLRVTAGMNLQKWIATAKAQLDLKDDGDRLTFIGLRHLLTASVAALESMISLCRPHPRWSCIAQCPQPASYFRRENR